MEGHGDMFNQGAPDDADLLSLTRDILKLWRPLGLALGLEKSHLNEISEDQIKAEDRAYAMLKQWKESKGSEANYERLAQGLGHKGVRRRDLIEIYCRDKLHILLEGILSSLAGLADHDKEQSDSPGRKSIRISGVYESDPRNKGNQVFKMEHSALQQPGNHWDVEVKYRKRKNKAATTRWDNVWDFYPNATVKVKHNFIELTIPSVEEGHEFVVFGTPETSHKKRMQMGIFGEKPTQGKDWSIHVTLFDDTMRAFKRVCEREESKGRQLLTTLAGLFVSNSDEDIKVDIRGLVQGWQIKGSKVKTIKSKDAWNSPENSTDFPSCVFEIAHVEVTKQSFFCGITVSHLNDTANTEVVAFFEQNEVNVTDQDIMASQGLTVHEDNVIEVFVILQMLIFLAGCFTGAGCVPHS